MVQSLIKNILIVYVEYLSNLEELKSQEKEDSGLYINGVEIKSSESKIILNLESFKNEYVKSTDSCYKLFESLKDEEKNKIIKEIHKDDNEKIVLLTDDKELFINFNRNVELGYITSQGYKKEDFILIPNLSSIINCIKYFNIHYLKYELKNIFEGYGKIFNINIETLTKETNYKVDNKDDFLELVNEDINLLEYKKILTSRLAIVLYRLFFFDLHTKSTAIGYFFKEQIGTKSTSFKFINLYNNEGLYFSNLVNKSFRGYKIPLFTISIPDDLFVEKIKIAKKLLKLKVKMKTVSEAIEIDENELNKIIYEDNNAIINAPSKEPKSPFDGIDIPISKRINTAAKTPFD